MSCFARQHGALSRSETDKNARQLICEEVKLSAAPCPPTNYLWKFTLARKLHLC